jgi:predicted GNAT family N-acyltransferase
MMLIYRAKLDQEFKQVYQLRYQCLTIELGDETYAHHHEGTYFDQDDFEYNRVFVACMGQLVVGTARLLFRKEKEFIADDFYEYENLAKMMGVSKHNFIQRTCLIDRVCILKEYRGHHIFKKIYELALMEMKHNNCDFLLAAIHVENQKSDMVFSHFGFQKIPELKQWKDWQGYLYFKNV